jgi:hypothetical protein
MYTLTLTTVKVSPLTSQYTAMLQNHDTDEVTVFEGELAAYIEAQRVAIHAMKRVTPEKQAEANDKWNAFCHALVLAHKAGFAAGEKADVI